MKKIQIQFTPESFIPAILQGAVEPTIANYEQTDIAEMTEPNDGERAISLESISGCLNVF